MKMEINDKFSGVECIEMGPTFQLSFLPLSFIFLKIRIEHNKINNSGQRKYIIQPHELSFFGFAPGNVLANVVTNVVANV